MPSRRFAPPWSVEETDACFIVRDANRQVLREFRQVLRSDVRAELCRSLIPFPGLGGIGLNADSVESLDDERIECLAQRKGGSSAACLGDPP